MIKYLQLPTCKLAEFASNVDTVFTVSGFLLNDGVTPVDPADIGDICYATLEPKTKREELISFTINSVDAAGIATITAVRGLLQKSPYTVGGASFDHQNGTDFVISNNPGLFNELTAKDNPEVITEQWSFPAPTGPSSPVTKAYADALVINGGADATNLSRGIALLSASPAVAIGTCTITVASPAVVSFVAHGLIAGDTVKFTTTGALPTGLVAGTSYYVIATDLTANTFKVAATIGGAAINTTGGQSGVHTVTKWTPVAVGYNDTTKLPTLAEKAALAGEATPSATNKFRTQNRAMTAGATINGATLPVPVYQDTTSFKYLACDGNDITRIKFQGFATSNSTDTNPINVQFDGVVGGFSGLTRGVKYYLQDAVGTIGTTPGTIEVFVGIAISTTELLIMKGKLRKAGSTNISAVTATGSEVITLGFRPSIIRLKALSTAATTTAQSSVMELLYANGVQKGISINGNDGGNSNMEINSTVLFDGIGNYLTFTITAVTDTGFTISYVETGTFSVTGAAYIWEAEGEF